MANLRDIRRRIGSVKNTAQITKAMQLVAASKMKKAQDQATMPPGTADWCSIRAGTRKTPARHLPAHPPPHAGFWLNSAHMGESYSLRVYDSSAS